MTDERPVTIIEAFDRWPDIFEEHGLDRFPLPIIRTLARWHFRIALRVSRDRTLPDADALAEEIAGGGDELGDVLRTTEIVRVLASFAADSPLRRRPR